MSYLEQVQEELSKIASSVPRRLQEMDLDELVYRILEHDFRDSFQHPLKNNVAFMALVNRCREAESMRQATKEEAPA